MPLKMCQKIILLKNSIKSVLKIKKNAKKNCVKMKKKCVKKCKKNCVKMQKNC